jgi:hypothetical protein
MNALRPVPGALLVGLLISAAPAAAQVRIGLHLGPVGATRLVRDSIVEPVTVRPNLSLAAGLSVETGVTGGYRAGLRFTAARSDVETHSPTQAPARVTTLTLWHPAAFLRHSVISGLNAEARLGIYFYSASPRAGNFFRDGVSPRPSLGLGIGIERPLGRRMAVEALLTYDLHRFTTPALRADGFAGETVVHRFALQFGIHRIVRDAQAR